MLSKTIRNLLLDPRIKDSSLDRDGVDLLRVHSEIIKSKTMIRHIFQEFYNLCIELDKVYFDGSGKVVELGSGVSFIKETDPHIITSDIKDYKGVDIVVEVGAAWWMVLPAGQAVCSACGS